MTEMNNAGSGENTQNNTNNHESVDHGEQSNNHNTYDGKLSGKFKTIEDLEKGYNELVGLQAKQAEELNRLKKVPEQYEAPEGVDLDESGLESLTNLAKEGGLSQDQYNRLAAKFYNDAKSRQNHRDESIKKQRERLGLEADARINDVNQYIDSHYPDHIAKQLKEDASMNPDSFDYFNEQRNKNLSITHTGTASGGAPKLITRQELFEARDAYYANQGDPDARNNYFAKLKQKAKQDSAA